MLDTDQCPFIEGRQIGELRTEILDLRSEVISLRRDTCALKTRIGNVRAWIKTGLLVFFILSTLIVLGQYIFTAQIEALSQDMRGIDQKFNMFQEHIEKEHEWNNQH